MSNLIRGQQDYLINSLTAKEFGSYREGDVTTGAIHLVMKQLGIDMPGVSGSVVIKHPALGNKQKRVLTPTWKWNGESEQLFEIEVTKQPLYTGFGHEQFPVSHTYGFEMTGFATTTPGTLADADKDAIINGLIAAIADDVARTANAVNTGSVVVATLNAHTLVLESKERGQLFTVRTFDNQFSQAETVAFKKDTLTNDEVARIFSIHPENAGQRVNFPTAGVDYCCITIKQRTEGYDNVVASGFINREQVYNIYMPVSALAATPFVTYATNGDNAQAMHDAPTTPNKTIVQLLVAIFGTANVLNQA